MGPVCVSLAETGPEICLFMPLWAAKLRAVWGVGGAGERRGAVTGPGIALGMGPGIEGPDDAPERSKDAGDVNFFLTETHSFSHRPTIL